MRDVKPIIGYVHTGIEKTCEDQPYWKVIPFVERMDYLSYYFNALAFCMAVERLLDEEVPERAQYLRVIHCELNRIASHLFWLGTSALDLGAISMLWWGFRDRDKVLDLFEMSSRPAHAHALLPGGRRGRGHPAPAGSEKARAFIEDDAHAHRRSTRRCSTATRSSSSARRASASCRRSGCSTLGRDRARCCAPRATRGTCARPTPYSSLRALRLQRPDRHRGRQLRPLPRADRGDARVAAGSSSRRSTACPRVPTSPPNRKVALPPRHELATSMEALIHHFKLVTEGFRVPPGEAYAPIESPARRARLLRAWRTARRSRRACTCATPRS